MAGYRNGEGLTFGLARDKLDPRVHSIVIGRFSIDGGEMVLTVRSNLSDLRRLLVGGGDAMISAELRARIRRLFYAEHWNVGTFAAELGFSPFRTSRPKRPRWKDVRAMSS